MTMAQDVPGARPLFGETGGGDPLPTGWVRVQRCATERRANRRAGLERRRALNQAKGIAEHKAAIARRKVKTPEDIDE